MGHFGLTNAYLVETRHELALLYNDKSPLENMHCAELFRTAGRPSTDIFNACENADRRQARQLIILAILHTDNTHHFEIVKSVKRVYETNSLACEEQACSAQTI